MISNSADPCKQCGVFTREIVDLNQQIVNLEEYVLKGVTFRDKLQAENNKLLETVQWAIKNAWPPGDARMFQRELRRKLGKEINWRDRDRM
mgnify:CR=1 FL=1